MPRSRTPWVVTGIVVAVVLFGLMVGFSRPNVDKRSPWYDRGYQIGHGVGTIQENTDRSDRFSSAEDGCDKYFDLLVRIDDPTIGVPLPEDRATFVAACLQGAKDPGAAPSGVPTPSV